MKKVFVKTKNVKNFIGLIERLQNKPKNIPKMGLIYGEPGLGKSQTALWLSCKYDGVYLRCSNVMTSRSLLTDFVKELDEIPRYLVSDNFDTVVQKLRKTPKIIFVDEIDYLMNNYKTIETLRDVHDETDCPIVFIGMSLCHKKLKAYNHLYDRLSEVVQFETFTEADVKEIFEELSEIEFDKSAISFIHNKYNRFRQLVQTIHKMEIVAQQNGFKSITKEIMEELI